MHSEINDAIHNSASANTHPQTGPRTVEGKTVSSRNALKDGLFAAHDFIRLGERDEYDAFVEAFRDQLAPEGALEELFAAEIIGANWRLRRCRLVEEDLSAKYEIDPMQDEEGAKTQKSVDRARAQAHNTIRRALAEMRKLQTERRVRNELRLTVSYGVADFPKVLDILGKQGLTFNPNLQSTPEPESSEPVEEDCKDDPRSASPEPNADSFCKPAQAVSTKIGRNELCPCGSGMKYKRCCINAPKMAA